MAVTLDAVDAATGCSSAPSWRRALGCGFEDQTAGAIPPQLEMQKARLGRGTYTHDTPMMIAFVGGAPHAVIVGAPSMEQRMIAWRVGWVVMPSELTDLVSRAQIYNGLVASGFAQIGTKAALEVGDGHVASATAESQRRRDETLRQLDGLPVVAPHGASAALLDTRAARPPAGRALRPPARAQGGGHADGRGGGEIAGRHLRFVFSTEPVERLALLGERVRAGLG